MRHIVGSPSSSSNDAPRPFNSGADSAYLSMRSDEDNAPPPPRIAPISGVLSVMAILPRPIAYKPPLLARLTGRCSTSTPSLLTTPSRSPWERNSPSSPSRGADGLLRNKEAEIVYLRQTLEHNEQVIFNVYAEKEQGWLREIRHLHKDYNAKIEIAEQRYNTDTSQLKSENERLTAELQRLQRETENNDKVLKKLREDAASFHSQLDEARWSVCHKTGEVSHIKTMLRESQAANVARVTEIFNLKNNIKELQKLNYDKDQRIIELSDAQVEYEAQIKQLQMTDESIARQLFDKAIELKSKEETSEIEHLRTELYVARQNLQLMQHGMNEERAQWEIEKERVIRYQKQIQVDYKQLCNKNWSLECEVQHLTIKLENKAGESNC